MMFPNFNCFFSGTEKQHVANDYAKRIAMGITSCEVSKTIISYLFLCIYSRLRTSFNQITYMYNVHWRRWGWIGHTIRKPTSSIIRHALTWNRHEKQRRSCPRNTLYQNFHAGTKKICYSWNRIESLETKTKNRRFWNRIVGRIYPR